MFDKLKLGSRRLADASRKTADKMATRFNEYVENRQDSNTAWLQGDDLGLLEQSANPLLKLEEQKVPRHARAAAVYFAAAAGVLTNAEDVTRFTRDLMDRDNAAVQQWLRKVFNPDEAREISLWMDTAPGAEYAGGWAHRLAHGHDLGAMFTLFQEHGYTGALEWANHVYLRDFWTPHGVPYLPAGSGTVYDWLVDVGVSPQTAMSLLTINAAELTTGLLAFYSGRRIVGSVEAYMRARDYKNRLEEVGKLIDEGSTGEALRLVGDTETFSNAAKAPHLRLDLAMICLEQSHKNQQEAAAWGERAFLLAFDLCRSSPQLPATVPYHGSTAVSFQGVAATVMASAYSSQLQKNSSDWSLLSDRLHFGIRRLLEVAERQARRSRLELSNTQMWGYRPYSACTNLLLALELAVSCGTLYGTTVDPRAIRRRLDEVLCNSERGGGSHQTLSTRLRENLARAYPLAPP